MGTLRIDRDALARRRGPWTALLALVALAGVAAAGWAWWRPPAGGVGPVRPTPTAGARAVRTVVVAAPGATGDVVGGGWIEAAPPAPIVVGARVAGTLVEVPVLPGDRVAAGDVVARLDDAAYRLARDAAAAEVALAERRLATRRAGSRAEDIAAAEAAVREAEAEVTRAAKALARVRTLAPDGTVSQASLERAEAEAAAATAARDARAAALARWRAGTRPEELAEAEAAVAVARVALARAEQELAWTEVRSPRDGVVLERFAHEGEQLAPDRAALTHGPGAVCALYDPADLQVRVDLPQAEAARVAVGQAAAVTLAAAPGRTFEGRVARIDPLADLAKNTVRVRVHLRATDAALRPDLTARVAFTTGAGGAALRIPARCVVRDGDATAVWQVAGGVARRVPVTLAPTTGPEVAVTAGLAGGETLVLDPPADLQPGEALAASDGGPR